MGKYGAGWLGQDNSRLRIRNYGGQMGFGKATTVPSYMDQPFGVSPTLLQLGNIVGNGSEIGRMIQK